MVTHSEISLHTLLTSTRNIRYPQSDIYCLQFEQSSMVGINCIDELLSGNYFDPSNKF